MPNPDWPDPPGWDPTPCCGSHALLPVLYPLARLRAAVHGWCWLQRDHSPVWPPPQ